MSDYTPRGGGDPQLQWLEDAADALLRMIADVFAACGKAVCQSWQRGK